MILGSDYLNRYADENGIDRRLVNPASIDLTLGNEIELYTWGLGQRQQCEGLFFVNAAAVTPHIQRRRVDLSDYPQGIWLLPGNGALFHTEQHVDLPRDVCAQILLKSSRGREFFQSCMAGFGDNGWHGQWTLEIYPPIIPIHLSKGMKIVQMKLQGMTHVGFAYGDPAAPEAHYLGQRGVTPSWEGLGHDKGRGALDPEDAGVPAGVPEPG